MFCKFFFLFFFVLTVAVSQFCCAARRPVRLLRIGVVGAWVSCPHLQALIPRVDGIPGDDAKPEWRPPQRFASCHLYNTTTPPIMMASSTASSSLATLSDHTASISFDSAAITIETSASAGSGKEILEPAQVSSTRSASGTEDAGRYEDFMTKCAGSTAEPWSRRKMRWRTWT